MLIRDDFEGKVDVVDTPYIERIARLAFERIEKIFMGLTTFGSCSPGNMLQCAVLRVLLVGCPLRRLEVFLFSRPALSSFSRSFAYVLEVIEITPAKLFLLALLLTAKYFCKF